MVAGHLMYAARAEAQAWARDQGHAYARCKRTGVEFVDGVRVERETDDATRPTTTKLKTKTNPDQDEKVAA
jgi:hypothetical protein